MSGNRQPQQVPDYTGLNLQTASMTTCVPLAWGQSRGAPNLIDYVNFEVHEKESGKGGAFFGKQETYTYSATIVLALCEGPISGIGYIYVNQGETTGLSQFGFTLFTGTTPQSPWSYMTTNYPTHALSYQGVAYLAAANYNLGESETLPSQSFEVYAPLRGTGYTGAGVDADCALIVQDFLTNSQYGAYYPASALDSTTLLSSSAATTTGDSAYQTYCRAMGWGFSPFYQNQEQALTILSRMYQATNTAPAWCGYTLKSIPFGDTEITANGVTYLPPTTSVFALGDNDFKAEPGNDPVEVSRSDWFDAYNAVAIEIRDRGYEYNEVPLDDVDLGGIASLGRRQAPSIQAHEICDVTMAKAVVQLINQRMVYVRNLYTFKVGPEWSLYEPMDCGTITVAGLGLANQPVRIREITEQDDQSLEWIVEEFPGTTGSVPSVAATGGAASPVNSQAVPDSVNAPIIFEPDSAACAFLNNGSNAPLIVALVSGGSGGAYDPNWGAAIVNVSTDATTYVPLSNIAGSTRATRANQGVLTASLASYGGTNPDTAHTLAVSLAESNGSLASASSGTTAAAGATLGVIQDAGGTFELIGPETATLSGTNAYNLTTLYRGLFGTTAASHSSGAKYGRVDSAAFIAALPAAYIGVTLYFKFQSVNLWGGQVQDLSTCTAYTYTPLGTGSGGGSGGVPTTPTGLTATAGVQSAMLAWAANPSTDNVTDYVVSRAPGTGASFSSASVVATVSALGWTDTSLAAATGYTYFLQAQNAIGLSSASAGVNLTTSATALLEPIYVPSTYQPGVMTTANQVMIYHKFAESGVVAANLAGWQFGASANATGSTIFTVQKAVAASPNSFSNIGTITVAASSITPTFASVGGTSYSFAIGDVLRIVGPATPDATLADPHITALLSRTS